MSDNRGNGKFHIIDKFTKDDLGYGEEYELSGVILVSIFQLNRSRGSTQMAKFMASHQQSLDLKRELKMINTTFTYLFITFKVSLSMNKRANM